LASTSAQSGKVTFNNNLEDAEIFKEQKSCGDDLIENLNKIASKCKLLILIRFRQTTTVVKDN
jgi:hypothetical protein